MENERFSYLLSELMNLAPEQKAVVMKSLSEHTAARRAEEIIDTERFRPACPDCGCKKVVKYGKISGLQRYRCKECKRTFNALTGTSMSHLRKKELWLEYSQALSDSLSLTKAAAKCGIDRTTAFRWRHRFLQDSGKASQPCTGITEIDETYFRESYKGKKLAHRNPRKRGKLSVRGLSKDQVPVVIARDRNGHVHDAVLGSRTAREVSVHLGQAISPESMLCIDNSRILIKFAKTRALPFETVNPKQRRGREKVFHVQNINAYHSRQKTWLVRFHGVATGRLANSLCWRRLHEQNMQTLEDWFKVTVCKKIHS